MSSTPEFDKMKEDSGFDPTGAAFEGIIDKNTPEPEVPVMDTATATEEVAEVAPAFAPTGLDRCDYCGAQAYTRVTMGSGLTILLCGHDAAKHKDAITAQGGSIEAVEIPK